MTQYYPGPYEVEIFYVEGGITHKQRLNTALGVIAAAGSPFSSFSVLTRAGTNVTLDTAVTAWVNLIRPLFAATTNFTIANLYRYAENSFDKTFLSTFDVNLVGSNAGGVQLNHQTILTFTTQQGNNMRVSFLDDSNALSSRIPIRDANAQIQAIATFLVGTTNWITARDGSYPVGRLNSSQGQNEALFKRRNR